MNLFSLVENGARKWPDHPAIAHGGRSFSYSELYRGTASLASELTRHGVRLGDKVGVAFPNGPEYIAAFFAVLSAGAIVVPISPALKSSEIANLTHDFTLDALCYDNKLASAIPAADEKRPVQTEIFLNRAPSCIKLAVSQGTPRHEREQLLKMHTACMAFSSGTTSLAKGIILSHETLLDRARMGQFNPPINKATAMIYMRPMDRTAMPYQICACFLAGGKVVIADSLSLESLPRILREHHVDQIYAGPLFYRSLIQQEITAYEVSGVRFFISGGGPLPPSVAQRFQEKFHREILQSYACIECAPMAVNIAGEFSKRGSVGKMVSGREVKLGSSDRECSTDGVVGEIFARGPGLFDGYYKPWQVREEVLEDGWFKTGDIARRDADGYYWIVGRAKEVINVGGVKVFPYEVEALLMSHPAIEDAMVYGVQEARFGEVPWAKVKLRTGARCTEKEIIHFANARLSVFKALRSIKFVNEIPRTVAGKAKRTSESQ